MNFQKGLCENYPALLGEIRPFLDEIPGIVRFDIFPNKSRYVPRHVESVGVEIIFEDRDALDAFMNHPKHYEANAVFERYLADPPYMVLTHEI